MKRFKQLLVVAITAQLTSSFNVFAQAVDVPQTAYKIVAQLPVIGTGKWDYLALDAKRNHLFISRSSHVQVINPQTGDLLGDIPNTAGVHGIAIDMEDNLGFTSNGKAGTVTVFNLDDFKTLATVKTSGADPDAILYYPELKQVYTFNGDGKNISVIDAVTYKLIHTIKVGATPEFGVSDHHGHIFFNIEDKSEIGVIDTATATLTHRWALPACDGPTGLALDDDSHRLFSTCQNKHLSVLDSESGQHITDVPIGTHPDGVIFDPDNKLVIVSNGGGTLTFINQNTPDSYTVTSNLATRKGARTMAYDPKTKRVYLMGKNNLGAHGGQKYSMNQSVSARSPGVTLIVAAPQN